MYRDGPCFVAKPYTLKVEAVSRGRTSTVARCTVDLARLCACSPAGSRTDLRLRLKSAPACAGAATIVAVHLCILLCIYRGALCTCGSTGLLAALRLRVKHCGRVRLQCRFCARRDLVRGRGLSTAVGHGAC